MLLAVLTRCHLNVNLAVMSHRLIRGGCKSGAATVATEAAFERRQENPGVRACVCVLESADDALMKYT